MDIADRQRFLYLVFGLTVLSDVECPELELGDSAPDLYFSLGPVPQSLPGSKKESLVGEVQPGLFRLGVHGVGSYLIREGRQVIIQPAEGAAPDAVRLFLLGPVLGILLHQRGLLPLHASAIASADGGVVFVGATGSGKSTIAAALLFRGYRVLADEICVVDPGGAGSPRIIPAPPYLSIWADALRNLGFGPDSLQPVRSDLRKFLLPAPREPDLSSVPIRVCYILDTSAQEDKITLEPLSGLRKIEELSVHTYRRSLIDALDLGVQNFEQICKIAASCRVVRIRRPPGEFTGHRIADAVEEDLQH
jgi:hypothetical protein